MRGFLILLVIFVAAYSVCVPPARGDLPRLGARPLSASVRDSMVRWNPLTRLSVQMAVQMQVATGELEALQ